MTAYECRIKLFEWFIKNESFCVERDSDKLLGEYNNLDIAILENVLNELVIEKVVISCPNQKIKVTKTKEVTYDTRIYVLVNPIQSYTQTITISGNTAVLVSEAVNQFYQDSKYPDMIANPLRIQEKDIFNLTVLIAEMNGVIILLNKKLEEKNKEKK